MNYGFPPGSAPAAAPYGYPPSHPQPFLPPGFAPMPMQPQRPPMEDRNFFRQWFMSGLRALTSTSKVVITDLTVAASEWSSRHADAVVQLLDEHVRTVRDISVQVSFVGAHDREQVDPSMKLPALYLIDSICKNIGPPYTSGFSQRIDRIFLSAYRDVDPATQIKMEELLGTWRTGGPNGTPLFHGRAQNDIEKTLFGPELRGGGIGGQGRAANDVRHFLSGAQQLPSMASQAERQGVLGDVRKLLGIWEMRKRIDPTNTTPDEQIKALQQLENLLTTATLTADMVTDIRNEVTNLTPGDSSSSEPVAGPSSAPDLTGIDFSQLSALLPARTPSNQSSAPVSANDAAMALLRALDPNTVNQLQGLVPSISVTAKTTDQSEADYEDLVLKMDLRLTATDIARYRPTAPELLYDRLPLQCKQCGARFLESSSGHAKLGAHTDRHFRHKKRLREATRAQSRSWFVSEEDWLTPPKRQTQIEAPVEPEKAAQKPLGRVVAPKDPARSARPCPICKEGFKSEFNEAEEEFVWLDAVEVDGIIYHDSCHREATKSRLVAKTAGSREGTPTTREATPVPPAKRKAEDAEESDPKRVKSEEPFDFDEYLA